MRIRGDLGSLGFTFFSFLFFSFLFFSFSFRRFFSGADSFCSFLFLVLFLDLNVIVELKLNVEINFFSNYYMERMEFPANFWNSILPVSYCSCSNDQ